VAISIILSVKARPPDCCVGVGWMGTAVEGVDVGVDVRAGTDVVVAVATENGVAAGTVVAERFGVAFGSGVGAGI